MTPTRWKNNIPMCNFLVVGWTIPDMANNKFQGYSLVEKNRDNTRRQKKMSSIVEGNGIVVKKREEFSFS